jgi:hypothetical protein
MPPGPRARREFRARGWTDAQLDEALRTRRLTSVHRGVLMPTAEDLSTFERSKAATRAVTGSTVGRRTAAELWELEGLPSLPPGVRHAVDLWVPPPYAKRHRAGLSIQQTLLSPVDVTMLAGIPVTTPARTVIDLGRIWALQIALVVADAALRQDHCAVADLQNVVDRLGGMKGVLPAREVVRLAHEGTRSCGETRGRLVIILGGLPEPTVAIQIRDDFGDLLAEADMGYRQWLIWIEYDGFDVHTQRPTFRKDRPRQRFVERRGWKVLRMTDWDVGHPSGFLSDLAAAIEDAPRRIAALPPDRSPEIAAARQVLGFDKPST